MELEQRIRDECQLLFQSVVATLEEPGAASPEPARLTAGLADALHLLRQPGRLPAPARLHPRLLPLHLVAQGRQPPGQVLLRPGFHLLCLCLDNSVQYSVRIAKYTTIQEFEPMQLINRECSEID